MRTSLLLLVPFPNRLLILTLELTLRLLMILLSSLIALVALRVLVNNADAANHTG